MAFWLINNPYYPGGLASGYVIIQQFSIPDVANFLCSGAKIYTKYGTIYTLDLCSVDGTGKPVGGAYGPYLARQTFNGSAEGYHEIAWPTPVLLQRNTQYVLRCDCGGGRRWYLGTPGGVIGDAYYWYISMWPWLSDLTIGIYGDYYYSFPQTVFPSSIVSAEVFGSLLVKSTNLFLPSSILSAEAFGTAKVLNPAFRLMCRLPAYDGYRCFMEQYIKNKVQGSRPRKLPDGTLWE